MTTPARRYPSHWPVAARFWGTASGARIIVADMGASEADCEIVPDDSDDSTWIVARTPAGLYALVRLLERGVVVRAPDLATRTTRPLASEIKT
jgi:hypothetical protein